MTSVLNVGVMTRNPVGNQIRSLQAQIDNERKVVQMLLSALESKSPDVFNEYSALKTKDDELSNQSSQNQNQQFQGGQQFQGNQQGGQQRFQQGGQTTRNPNGRF